MKITHVFSMVCASSILMLSVTACSIPNEGPTIPAVGLTINSMTGPGKITVTTSPLVLKARTSGIGQGSVEFFDDTKSIGKVGTGVTRPDVTNGYDFTLSVPVTKIDNGDHPYKFVFTGKDSAGLPLQVSSEPVTATIQLP